MAVYQSLTLTQVSQNQTQNTSQVKILWTSQQTGPSYNETQHTAYYYVSVNGGAETEYTTSYTLPSQTTKTIVSTTITVPHNNLGEATVRVRTWMDTNISAGVVTQSKSLTLDTIARESTLSASDVTIGGNTVVAINRKNNSFTNTVYLEYGNIKGYLGADGKLYDYFPGAYLRQSSITVPIGEEYYAETETTRGTVKLTCITYASDYTQIGSPQYATFTVSVDPSVCSPILTTYAIDVNQETAAITGDNQYIISGHSTVRVYATATAQKSAHIAAVTVSGLVISGEYLDLLNFSGTELTVIAGDSRLLTTRKTLSNTIIPYTPVTVTAAIERTDPTSGNATLTFQGNWYHKPLGGASAQENTLTVTYKVGSGESVTVTDVTLKEDGTYEGKATVTGLDYTTTHTVTVIASDLLTDAEQSLTVKKGVPVFEWGEGDFAFHVPLTIQGSPLADFVVEQGMETMSGNGTWYWRKWESGKAECYGHRDYGTLEADVAWGSMYTTANLSQDFPTGLFSTVPEMCVVNPYHCYPPVWVSQGYYAIRADNTGIFCMVSPQKVTMENTTISFHAIGRWK